MNKEALQEALQEALMKYSEENDVDLPKGWNLMGEAKLKELLDSYTGATTDVNPLGNVAVNGEQPVSTTNPFGEEIVSVVIPIDKQNPKVKTFWAAIRGKPLLFPVGKVAKMPMSYYLVYQKSIEADLKVQAKMEEYFHKEI